MERSALVRFAGVCLCIGVFPLAATRSRADDTLEGRWAEATEFVRDSKITLLSAVIAARAQCPTGTPFRAGISRHHPTHAFEVLFLSEDRKRVVHVEIDAICGEPLAADEDEPRPAKDIATVAALAIDRPDRLERAVLRAAKLNQGTVIGAELRARKNAVSIVAVSRLTPAGINQILIAPLDETPVHLVRRSERVR